MKLYVPSNIKAYFDWGINFCFNIDYGHRVYWASPAILLHPISSAQLASRFRHRLQLSHSYLRAVHGPACESAEAAVGVEEYILRRQVAQRLLDAGRYRL